MTARPSSKSLTAAKLVTFAANDPADERALMVLVVEAASLTESLARLTGEIAKMAQRKGIVRD
jgi:hypothetical protein